MKIQHSENIKKIQLSEISEEKNLPSYSFPFFHFSTIILFALLSFFLLFLFGHFFIISADAQDLLFDEQIKAYAITRFEEGFTKYEVRLTWSALEGSDEYKFYKSINENEFEQITVSDYDDEGFQLWWTDDDILEGNTYSYYIEGYQQGQFVEKTEQVDVDFWLPPCPAVYPVNNETVIEENPEFKWNSISINTFPFRNIIFSAQGKFILFDLTAEQEIIKIEIEDFNRDNVKLLQEEANTEELRDETATSTDIDVANLATNIDIDDMADATVDKIENDITGADAEAEAEADITADTTATADENTDTESLLVKKHQYQWQYQVTGYNNENNAIAESVTGGRFIFQEEADIDTADPDKQEEDLEKGLNIDADSLTYQVIDGEDVIIAKDRVNLRYRDIALTADFVQIIVNQNELIAKDKIIFTKGKESYSSEFLSYNWETDKIVMNELSGEATGKKIKGKVYYQGGKLENFPETTEITSGSFTTCDLSNPHWHIEAEQITIYPDDKIIAKKVSWYEGKKKIFTLPSFMIFLRGKNQLPYLPDIGQSSSEGWFFKNQFNYVENATSYGSIYLDWMQKKGLGAGIEHTFELGEETIDDGELVLYLYALHKNNTDLFGLDAKISYWENFENDLRLRANVVYDGTIVPGGGNSTHTVKPDFYLYKKWEDALLTLTGKYNFNITDLLTSSGNIKMSYDYTLTDKLKSYFDLLYTSQDPGGDQAMDLELRPEWLLKYSGKGYTLSLVTEKQIDLDGDLFTGDGTSKTLDKLPELTFKKNSSKIKNTDIYYSIDASIARYYEGSTDQENVRGEYIVNMNRLFKINDHVSLNASGVYRQDVYLTGEARYLLGGKLDLKVGYQPEFYGTVSYHYYMSEGPTPFNFDALSPLTESASASLVLKPKDNLQVNLSTNYNFVSESFGSLGAKIKWEPKEDNEINLSTSFDLNNQEWNKRVDTKMALKLNEKWKLAYSGSVYFDDFDIRNSVISVVRDLHCREISINYKQSTQSVWLDFKINAFPTESITIGG